jgi:hypothetical protein
MEASTQYFSYEGAVGAATKTITVPIKKVTSISFTNDGTDSLVVQYRRDGYTPPYSRTVKAAETFLIDGNFDTVIVASPATGETNSFRLFVLGE